MRSRHLWTFPLLSLFFFTSTVVHGRIACESDADCLAILQTDETACDLELGACWNPFYLRGGCLFDTTIPTTTTTTKSTASTTTTTLNTRTHQPKSLYSQHHPRVCHSEDPASAHGRYCRSSRDNHNHNRDENLIPYSEVRISSLNWESALFNTWLRQIVLSELLGVPTTVETGVPGLEANFYHAHLATDYGTNSQQQAALQNAQAVQGDCTRVTAATAAAGQTQKQKQKQNRLEQQQQQQQQQPPNNSSNLTTTTSEDAAANDSSAPSSYQPCAHVSPELWADSQYRNRFVELGIMEASTSLGALAQQSWFVPRRTARKDPRLAHYLGLQNLSSTSSSHNVLADTFATPLNFGTYCQQQSSTQCQTPDGTAARPPRTDTEAAQYFVPDGVYRGHFQKMPEQDCDVFPDTCYGHIADYPCSWTSFVRQNAYHLGIRLRSTGPDTNGGYSSAQLRQIWAAANATQSDVMIMWWTPEPMYETYLGTEMELTRVTLPPPTQTCLDHRVSSSGVCEAPLEEAVGSPLGACDTTAQGLRQGLSPTLATDTNHLPPELRSPAYEALQKFQISELEYGAIFQSWLSRRGNDTDSSNDGYYTREAVCQWARDNVGKLLSFVPDSYPRIRQATPPPPALFGTAAVGAGMGLALAVASAGLTYWRRSTKAMYYINEVFLYLILAGLAIVAIAVLLVTTAAPTSAVCLWSRAWLPDVGYTLAIMPLTVRLYAQCTWWTSGAGQQMQRVRVRTERLLSRTAVLLGVVVAFLLIWTVLDPPRRQTYYQLRVDSDSHKEEGVTVVAATDYCGGDPPPNDSGVWFLLSDSWKSLLALLTAVIAFMASRVREDLNDTRSLSVLSLVYLLFSTLRMSLSILRDSTNPVHFVGYTAVLTSLEVLSALLGFVLPRILSVQQQQQKEPDEQLPDLFLRTSILYAEIVGLSAWSSKREPAQVFKFLESVYTAFDKIAEKRRVFKVETIGGIYVAATGIPHDRTDHAVALTKFSVDIQSLFESLTKEMDVLYGPDTSHLGLKIGMHSGAVTGGFLRGKGARFQLFGDTMDIGRQILETSASNKIHVSDTTARALVLAGKDSWLVARNEKTFVTGHGDMETQWVSKSRADLEQMDEFSCIYSELVHIPRKESALIRKRRLVKWNVEVLAKLLKQIVARRAAGGTWHSLSFESGSNRGVIATDNPLEEVQEIIELPAFDRKIAKRQVNADEIELPEPVMDQLLLYVTAVAEMYRDNPFHNFAHASHVVMSTLKHLGRIVAPTTLDEDEMHVKHRAAAVLHDHTYGITSDPLTQFACVFSALIHDLDHPGVPNPQLAKEKPQLAEAFKNRSVAEQNSFQMAWQMLLQEDFNDLRKAICGVEGHDMHRFRQLVINSVMATDLGDKQLKELRNSRWSKAFSETASVSSAIEIKDDVNRKATIVIEHLIQASDVSHTMQHWEVYREWNENLFREMYQAYRAGRAGRNPADFWYEGEIGFFDFYIVPLSKKLNDCGVFGISSDENLNYASRNRELWVALGQEATAQMLVRAEKEWNAQVAVYRGPEVAPEK